MFLLLSFLMQLYKCYYRDFLRHFFFASGIYSAARVLHERFFSFPTAIRFINAEPLLSRGSITFWEVVKTFIANRAIQGLNFSNDFFCLSPSWESVFFVCFVFISYISRSGATAFRKIDEINASRVFG